MRAMQENYKTNLKSSDMKKKNKKLTKVNICKCLTLNSAEL